MTTIARKTKKNPTITTESAAVVFDMKEHRRSQVFSDALLKLAHSRLAFFHETRAELRRLTTIHQLALNDMWALFPLIEHELANVINELRQFVQTAERTGETDAAAQGRELLEKWEADK